MEAGINCLQDRAHGFLVEAFVPFAPLQVFEMAADRALAQELSVLVRVDPAGGEATIEASPVHVPAFARGEGLAEEREIGERFHRLDIRLGLQPLA